MGFLALEQSVDASKPLELYRFTMGGSEWCYTSADHIVSYGGKGYAPVYINRQGFTRGNDLNRATLEVEVAAGLDVTMGFRTGLLPAVMLLTLYRLHYEDGEAVVMWKGRVTSCRWQGSVATLAVDSIATILRRAGLRRVYQIMCPHALYLGACKVNPDDWQFTGATSAVAGNIVTVTGAGGYPNGYFTGGVIAGGNEVRLITQHVGAAITMIDSMADLIAGASVSLWPGCDRTMAICNNRFGNVLNFGGLPFLPPKNPFSGDSIA